MVFPPEIVCADAGCIFFGWCVWANVFFALKNHPIGKTFGIRRRNDGQSNSPTPPDGIQFNLNRNIEDKFEPFIRQVCKKDDFLRFSPIQRMKERRLFAVGRKPEIPVVNQ